MSKHRLVVAVRADARRTLDPLHVGGPGTAAIGAVLGIGQLLEALARSQEERSLR